MRKEPESEFGPIQVSRRVAATPYHEQLLFAGIMAAAAPANFAFLMRGLFPSSDAGLILAVAFGLLGYSVFLYFAQESHRLGRESIISNDDRRELERGNAAHRLALSGASLGGIGVGVMRFLYPWIVWRTGSIGIALLLCSTSMLTVLYGSWQLNRGSESLFGPPVDYDSLTSWEFARRAIREHGSWAFALLAPILACAFLYGRWLAG